MAEKSGSPGCCDTGQSSCSTPCCCSVEALVTIDERGQMVIPKELRDKAGVKAGDKFVVVSCQSEGGVYCILMVKADDFAETMKGMLGPMMKEALQY